MNRLREEFIAQFAIPFLVIASSLVEAGDRATLVAKCCFEWIGITTGTVSLRAHDFAVIARPVIDELYRTTPRGQPPDANDDRAARAAPTGAYRPRKLLPAHTDTGDAALTFCLPAQLPSRRSLARSR
jgi:hypothetical protein